MLILLCSFSACARKTNEATYKGDYYDGYANGYSDGYSEAELEMEYLLDEKFSDGYDCGYDDGYEEGSENRNDYDEGYEDGYDEGEFGGYYAGLTYACIFFGDVDRAFQSANTGAAWHTFLDAYDEHISNIFDDDETRSELFWSLISVTLGDDATEEEKELLISAFGKDLFTRNDINI